MIVDIEQWKQDASKKRLQEHCLQYEDYYEYCLVDDYTEKYHHFRVHAVQVADVFASILEEQGHYTLVAITFFKSQFTLPQVALWMDTHGVHFVDSVDTTAIHVSNACQLIDSVRFMGRPLVVYKQGPETISCDVEDCVEVSDVYHSYDCIVNSAHAIEVEVEQPCKATILYNGERVYSVPNLKFDLSRDLVMANGLVIVADYMEDYCGTVGLWQEDNPMLPVMFFYDDVTPIYINVQTKENGSRVCLVEQAVQVRYDEL